jgi:peptidoglycan/LPS O-acetylase OafA/YrhL
MVEFFFLLSGFIFYKKYSDEIANNNISLKNFVILRLSRLYPLIVVTLLVICLLNYILFYTQHKFFIYSTNDFTAFFLNLFFLQSGFFNVGHSFNAPSWSLEVEFWVYLMFFSWLIRAKINCFM